jgi:hypothetical protein
MVAAEDSTVQELQRDDQCEWVRSRYGILGLVRIDERISHQEVKRLLDERVAHAHSVLDQLPDEALSFEDLWNLLLMISVPWNIEQAEADRELAELLLSCVRDTTGSRKIIIWRGTSPTDYIGRLGKGAGSWMPASGDPLREAADATSQSDTERQVLEILFKRRISEKDVDQLIQTLGHPSGE